jgi:hypothetical protein
MIALAGVGWRWLVWQSFHTQIARGSLRRQQLLDLQTKTHAGDIFDSHHPLHNFSPQQPDAPHWANLKHARRETAMRTS